MSETEPKRYIVWPNGDWWAVWDLHKDFFAQYRGTWLSGCGEEEAKKLCTLLNTPPELRPQ
jgi:hypothetical protein